MLSLRWIGYAALLIAVAGGLPAATAAQATQSVELSPGSGSPGTEVRVTGSGWWAGAPVRLLWESSDVLLLAEAAPARQRDPAPGTFSVSFIVPDAAPGTYRIWAVGGDLEWVQSRGIGPVQNPLVGARPRIVPVTVEAPFLVLPPQQAAPAVRME